MYRVRVMSMFCLGIIYFSNSVVLPGPAKDGNNNEIECPRGSITQEAKVIQTAQKSSDQNTLCDQMRVEKMVLSNGMTVLVFPVHDIPKVSLQLWYGVGSKDEGTGEKGIAHLIEHMVFKGTTGKGSLNISESDINTITHILSGSCNAFTAWDYTGYLFNMPTQNWKEALPIMADCMQHCSFKDDHLNSEMKAVVQELKMRRDKYGLSLYEEMLTALFPDHPYHYPIIGYKPDLYAVRGKDLLKFYKKYYHPNNATLVVVGDVQTQEVFDLAKKYFGGIKRDTAYKPAVFYHHRDLIAKSVTMYRDIAHPFALVAYTLPGSKTKNKVVLDIIAWLLGNGRGSRLYRKIVDELQLATALSCSTWSMFDYTMLSIGFEPKTIEDIDTIVAIIQDEIDLIADQGVQENELVRAIKKSEMDYYATLEDTQDQAHNIGEYYLATGDENYTLNYKAEPTQELQDEIKNILTTYCRASLRNEGRVLPLNPKDKDIAVALQKESDEEDSRIMAGRKRTTPVEEPSYAKKIVVKEAKSFNFPKAKQLMLDNGLNVLYHNNPRVPTLEIKIRFKALVFYDPVDKQGLYNFMMGMLDEGTLNYTAAQLSDELESRGMSFRAYPGGASMSMLSADFQKGLELLYEILTKASFTPEAVEKVRSQLLTEIKTYWDNPSTFVGQLVRERVYAGHPYSQNGLGTPEVVSVITRDELVDFYHKVVTPQGATMAIVGDLCSYNMAEILDATLGSWQGPKVEEIKFPPLCKTAVEEIIHPINRDQVTLSFAALSVARTNSDFDKLYLFDQILAGGVLGSMKSRLFKLREQTGLFYGIGGSLAAQADEQPGMVLVRTMVSLDRLAEAEKAIKDTLRTVTDDITDQELLEAKHALINTLAHNFESNASTASSFLFLDRYKLPATYFDTRAKTLLAITKDQVKAAVKKVLKADELCVVKVGRVGKALEKDKE